jgi:LacI family gluconate utilization system Gnt-I transcriptional repressor
MIFHYKDRRRSIRVEDVAYEAGVSPITVSRTLSSPDLVRAETRERVLRAVERLGYVVNTHASSLRSGRSTIISMFVSGIGNPHTNAVMRGCAEVVEAKGFHLIVTQVDSLDTLKAEQVNSVQPLRPAALVFVGTVSSPELREVIAERDVPVMEMWDLIDDPIDMLVGFCHRDGGRQMGRHFAEQGFRHPVYAGRTTGRGADRFEGFTEALADAGVKPVPVPVTEPVSFAAGHHALQAALAAEPECDAIFFSNDVLAIGASMYAATDPALAPIALAGFGDIVFTEQLPVPLTTVRTSGQEVGRRAGDMLLRRLAGETIGERIVACESVLQVRASTTSRRGAKS